MTKRSPKCGKLRIARGPKFDGALRDLKRLVKEIAPYVKKKEARENPSIDAWRSTSTLVAESNLALRTRK